MAHGQPPALRGGRGVRLTAVVAGLLLFALGIVMTLRSDVGLGPWDVLHQGVADHSPLSFGTAGIVVGVGVLAAALALGGVHLGVGTVLNAVLIGAFVDLIILADVVPEPDALASRLALDVAGVATIGIGTALYIGANMGTGPRDSLMLAVGRRLGVRVSLARTAVELGALAAGAALGGTVGVGTLIFALGVGPAVELAFRVLGRSPLTRPGRTPAPVPA
jgi:uncharacterized membrane protein YczE